MGQTFQEDLSFRSGHGRQRHKRPGRRTLEGALRPCTVPVKDLVQKRTLLGGLRAGEVRGAESSRRVEGTGEGKPTEEDGSLPGPTLLLVLPSLESAETPLVGRRFSWTLDTVGYVRWHRGTGGGDRTDDE